MISKKTIREIVKALKGRVYKSYVQLRHYISLDDDSYITGFNEEKEKILMLISIK